MAKIVIGDLDPSRALSVVQSTFEARGYLWEPGDGLTATASEGGEEVGNKALSRRLQVGVEVQPQKSRVVLEQRTRGMAYVGAAGVGLFTAVLNWRFAKVKKAVKADLEAVAAS